jgi:hypothetical protein
MVNPRAHAHSASIATNPEPELTMSQSFNSTPVLDRIGGGLSLLVMAGLTVAGLVIGAAWLVSEKPSATLPVSVASVTQVVDAVVSDVVQLPAVIVTVKRAGNGV